jgi:hypothetical protein
MAQKIYNINFVVASTTNLVVNDMISTSVMTLFGLIKLFLCIICEQGVIIVEEMVGDPYFLCSKKSYHHLHPLLLEGEHYFFNRSEKIK